MAGLSDDEVMAAPAAPQQASPQPQATPQQPAEWDLSSAPRVAPHAIQGNPLEQTDLGDADYARLQAKLRGEFVPAPKAAPLAKSDQAPSIGQQAIANVRAGKPALSEPPRAEVASAAKGMSDDEVMAAPPAPKGGSGLGRGLLEGTGYLLGMPADVARMTDNAYEWMLTKALEKTGVITPEQSAKMREPIPGFDEKWGGSEEINNWLFKKAQDWGANVNPPKTTLGKIAESIGSFIPSSIAMGPMGSLEATGTNALRMGVIPGIASELAGEATKDTSAEPYVRGAAALAAGQPLGALSRSPNRILGSVLRDVTPQQFSDAQAILNASRSVGAPLTLAEAIQGVTNSGTRMGDIQRVVEQSPAGASVMRPFFAQRPAQTEAFGRQTLGQIGPTTVDPAALGERVGQAAQTAVDATPQSRALNASVAGLGARTTAEDAGTAIRTDLQGIYEGHVGRRAAQADQDYAAARAADYGPNGEEANPVRVQAVIAHLDDLLTSAKGGVADALNRVRATLFREGRPDMSVTGLDNARKEIADQISAATRAGRNNESRLLQDVMGQLDYALERVPLYGQARRNFAANSVPLEPFARQRVPGRIVEQDQYGRRHIMPTENIAPAIGAGVTPVDDFLRAAGSSQASRQAFGRWFAQHLVDGARNASGRIDVDALRNALTENSDILRRFPEVVQRLQSVSQARTALRSVELQPIGQLAATNKVEQHALALFNTNPIPGSENRIMQAVRAIAVRDPEAAQQLVRIHLERTFNEAIQDNLPGPNQFGGPKFVAVVAGNAQQERNIEAALEALPQGNARLGAYRSMMRIFRAMGTRMQPGSMTAYNQELQQELRGATPLTSLAPAVTSPWALAKQAERVYGDWKYGRNTAEIARALTEGNVNDLRRLALAPTGSPRAQAALVALVGSGVPGGDVGGQRSRQAMR